MSSIAQASSSLSDMDRAFATGSSLLARVAPFYTGGMGSVIKKRRKAMNKHKYRKRLKKERWQRRHG
jgi:hypothetical protein